MRDPTATAAFLVADAAPVLEDRQTFDGPGDHVPGSVGYAFEPRAFFPWRHDILPDDHPHLLYVRRFFAPHCYEKKFF